MRNAGQTFAIRHSPFLIRMVPNPAPPGMAPQAKSKDAPGFRGKG